jgi:hypothetical protein
MAEYSAIYLKQLKLVTKAARPSLPISIPNQGDHTELIVQHN